MTYCDLSKVWDGVRGYGSGEIVPIVFSKEQDQREVATSWSKEQE